MQLWTDHQESLMNSLKNVELNIGTDKYHFLLQRRIIYAHINSVYVLKKLHAAV